MKVYIAMLMILGLIASWSVNAQEFEEEDEGPAQVSESDMSEQNEMSDANAIDNAVESIEEWSDQVLEKFEIDDYGLNDGKIFLFAQKPVALKTSDPEFGQAVLNAIDLAMADIQEQFVLMMYGRVFSEKAREFFQDSSTDAKDFPDQVKNPDYGVVEKMAALFEKKLDVEGKKLDAELVELGVDQRELQSMPEKQKKNLFLENFVKTIGKRASGDMSGLFPIQTILVRDDKGDAAVGVVAIHSEKTVQVARDIRLKRASLIQGDGRDLVTMLPASKDEHLGFFGVRLVYDTDGTPAIVSYGIGSYQPDADSYISATMREDAKQQAYDNAVAQLSEVINGYLSLESVRDTGQKIEKFVEREMTPDSMSVEKVIKNMVNISRQSAKSKASMDLKGTSKIGRGWTQKIDSGQTFVGQVVVWRYSTLDAMNAYGKPPRSKSAPVTQTEEDHSGGRHESRPVNSLRDF